MFERPDDNEKKWQLFPLTPAASGQWIFAAGAASLESIELGPQRGRSRFGSVHAAPRKRSMPSPVLGALTLLNLPRSVRSTLLFSRWGFPCSTTTALLRAVFDESAKTSRAMKRGTHPLVSRILEAATNVGTSPERQQVGDTTLRRYGDKAEEGGVNFQATVLKILVSYPDKFAVMANLKRDTAILATSGRDWAERTKRLAARVPALDIYSQGLVERLEGGGSRRRVVPCSN